MAQANPLTPARINVCALRVTRLNEDGTIAAGPNNGFVSRKLISIAISPVVDAGSDQVLASGCGDDIARWRTDSIFRGFTLTITKGLLEPALEEMMLGGGVISDDSTLPVPIGIMFPVSGDTVPPVAVEAWSKLVIGSHAPGPADTGTTDAYPYVRYLFPFARFVATDTTMELDFGNNGMTGTTQDNPNWGEGPWGDQPVAADAQGFYVYDSFIPDPTYTYVQAGT